MGKQPKPGLRWGALIGALLALALTALLYLAAQIIGTPFAPFDMFDWASRVLPGDIIRFGIRTIVTLITTFQLGETSSAAKIAEQVLAVIGLLVTGAVAGGVGFNLFQMARPSRWRLLGLLVGLAVGAPVMFISAAVNLVATTSPLFSSFWILATFGGWGVALAWAYERLTAPEVAIVPSMPPAPPIPEDHVLVMDRRRFLVTLGGATAVVTVVGAGLGALIASGKPAATVSASTGETVPTTPLTTAQAWSETNALPNADDPLLPVPGTRPELTPLTNHYRIDINLLPPSIRESEWRLQWQGLVDTPLEMTLAQIRAYPAVDEFVTLACISNGVGGDLIGTQRWTGVSLQTLLKDVPLKADATYLKISSADSFDEYVSLDLIRKDARIMLAYAWDGLALEVKHGFPLRIYIPNHYGMKQPKWISTIEAVAAWDEGYWVRRGWDEAALMRATSMIDTVAIDNLTGEGDQKRVPVGGIAHAGDRGISKVEVRVDEGEWVEADLRRPMSQTTWVLWRYEWPFEAGDHLFEVRCVDGNGTPQIERVADVAPSGATGIHRVQVTL